MHILNLDKHQQQALKKIKSELFKKSGLFSFFRNTKKGLYVFGPVGSGKTYLLKEICNQIKEKKLFIHYHNFLIQIQDRLNNIKNTEDKIELLCKNLSKEFSHIFIDELEILDITDAMLMKNIVPTLIKHKVKLYFTTNIKVNNIYKDGIQRDSILPLIKYIESNFLIYELNNQFDYRDKVADSESKRYFTPNSQNNNNFLDELFSNKSLNDDQLKFKGQIIINHHKFKYQYKNSNMIYFDFKDLFEINSANRDFEKLTKKFDVIFIKNIRKIQNNENNIIKRFINFIDLLYINKKKLILTSEIDIKNIYKGRTYAKEFTRTKSRLNEIESFK